MPEWVSIPGGIVVGLIGAYLGFRNLDGGSKGLFVFGGGLVMFGISMISMGIVYTSMDDDTIREECAVVGTSAEDATYVCVEVTE